MILYREKEERAFKSNMYIRRITNKYMEFGSRFTVQWHMN